jgi:hypothetical protein
MHIWRYSILRFGWFFLYFRGQKADNLKIYDVCRVVNSRRAN